MHTVTSFHAGSVAQDQLSAVIADHLALDQARLYRRLFVSRFGVLAAVLGIVGFGFHWMSAFASSLCVAICAVVPAWAWMTELRCDWRLAKRLGGLPAGTTHMVIPPKAIRKS